MYDNLSIVSADCLVISHLSESFFTSRNMVFEKIYNQNAFKLYNPKNKFNKAPLRVQLDEFGKSIRITGSVRKWYFGANSLEDFTIISFIDFIKSISSILEIPFKEFCQSTVSMVEIGMNIKTTERCSTILNMIVGYKSACYETVIQKGYKRFKTASFGIKLYDKFEEIIGNKRNKKFINTIDEANFIDENKDRNWIRIELKINKGKNLIKRIGYKTIGEMIDNFNDLYLYFWDSIQDLQFSDIYTKIPVFNPENKSDKEFMDFIKVVGINTIGVENINQMASKLKHRRMRTTIKKIYDSQSVRFSSYDKVKFCNNVMGQIILSLIKSDQTKVAKETVPKLRHNSKYNTI